MSKVSNLAVSCNARYILFIDHISTLKYGLLSGISGKGLNLECRIGESEVVSCAIVQHGREFAVGVAHNWQSIAGVGRV